MFVSALRKKMLVIILDGVGTSEKCFKFHHYLTVNTVFSVSSLYREQSCMHVCTYVMVIIIGVNK